MGDDDRLGIGRERVAGCGRFPAPMRPPVMERLGMVGVLCLGVGLVGCAGPKPILYPNAHFQEVGEAVAKQDTRECMQLAKEAGARPEGSKAGQVAGSTAVGAGVGAAAGAAGGAVVGAAGRGSAVGAATGAVGGLLRGLFRRPAPSRAYMEFVNRCLQDRGYEPVGWE